MMTTNPPCPPDDDDTAPCDKCPGDLDAHQCEAVGITKRAEYLAKWEPDVKKARDAYGKARTAYSAARAAVDPQVAEIRRKLERITEQIECQLHDQAAVGALQAAYEWVIGRIEACEGSKACCADDLEHDFGTEVENKLDALAGTIELFRQETTAAQDCFTGLEGEPAALRTRVNDLTKVVDELAKAVVTEASGKDHHRLLIRALVAGRALDEVWLGFGDVNDYVACLCRALISLSRGHRAIAELIGRKEKLVCEQGAAKACCVALRKNIEEEILARYLKKPAAAGVGAD